MSKNVFCSNCGDKVQEGMQFCVSCGAKVVEAAAEVVTEPQAAPTPQTETSGPTAVGAPVATGTPPTQEEKNKLILFMILSIIIPIVGIVLGIIKYNKKDKRSGQHYLLCGLSGFCFALGAAHWSGFVAGALLIASAVYSGLKQINAGVISADF